MPPNWGNLEKMDKFLLTCLLKLSKKKHTLNRLITRSKTESVKKNFLEQWQHQKTPQKPRLDSFTEEFYPNIQRTYLSQTIPEDWRGGNITKFILWGHYLEENIGETLFDKSQQYFLISISQGERNKSRDKQMELNQI